MNKAREQEKMSHQGIETSRFGFLSHKRSKVKRNKSLTKS